MTCANRTHATVFAMPKLLTGRWNRTVWLKALFAVTEAFCEALDMQRAAHRSRPLNDE
jgi:hypothetical protein